MSPARRHPFPVRLTLPALLVLLLVTSMAAPAAGGARRFEGMEFYALELVNCLRTGGRVTPGGACIGYGSGRFSVYREPLRFSHKISNKVAFPWASRIARANYCAHDLAGSSIDRRFRTVGLRSTNGENVACHSAHSPRRMVIFWVRNWYRETSWGGAHWHQIKDPRFQVAGLGVAMVGGRTRLVIDFYGRHVD